MALNRFMHPRNIYKTRKPNFLQLSELTSYFDALRLDESQPFTMDFGSAEHLIALTKALLKIDFGLEVDFSPDRLIPTIPLRLNYILWLEDIFAAIPAHPSKNYPPMVLDIGVGASCIYPLLGAKKNQWKFIGTDIDKRSFEYAQSNVNLNGLSSHITLAKVPDGVSPLTVLFENKTHELFSPENWQMPEFIDIVMANPPFFANPAEAVGATSTRTDRRKTPVSVASAARHEAQTPGGEVYFTFKLAKDFVKFRDRIGIVTVMLGKQSSVKPVKKILKKLEIRNISVYELCQGRVMRWGVAWSFNNEIKFPISEFRLKRKLEKPPLLLQVPEAISSGTAEYSVEGILEWLHHEFQSLQMKILVQKNRTDIGGNHLLISAEENTWVHSRRRRRELARQAQQQHQEPMETATVTTSSLTGEESPQPAGEKRAKSESDGSEPEMKRQRVEVDAQQAEEALAWLGGNDDEEDERNCALEALKLTGQPIIMANVFVECISSDDVNEEDTTLLPEEDPDNEESIDSALDETSVRFVIKFHDLNTGLNNSRDILHQLILYLRNRLV